jgi:hypothetical protein
MEKNRSYRERSELSCDSHDSYLTIARDPARDSAHELTIPLAIAQDPAHDSSRAHEITIRYLYSRLGVGVSSMVGVSRC